VKTRVESRLGQVRKGRGVTASELARRTHVTRQTIYAIEAGTYSPNTEVALNLARELEVTVDELFSLRSASPKSPESLAAEVLSSTAPVKGQPVRICQIGSRWVSVPVSASPYYLPEADGIIKRIGHTASRADLVVFAKEEAAQKRLVLAGCDPATGLLSRMVEKISGVEIVSAAASSKLALTWLSEGRVHIAGRIPKPESLISPSSGKYFQVETSAS
jgi:DNA-binding XRE family transcriptional regulator